MRKIALKAYAKVNWSLDIIGLREDGYHLLETVMQSIDLSDLLTLELKSEPGIVLEVVDAGAQVEQIPPTINNLAFRGAKIFCQEYEKRKGCVIPHGISIHLTKNIPSQAGLGGGSADCAAVLYGMNRLYGNIFTSDELKNMGLSIGADVPFCLQGGVCLAHGIGEKLQSLEGVETTFLLTKPSGGASTVEIFKAYDEYRRNEKLEHVCCLGESPLRKNTGNMIKALKEGDKLAIASSMYNCLYEPCAKIYPRIQLMKEALVSQKGCLSAGMTGSGSAVIGLFDCDKKMERAKEIMQEKGFRSWIVKSTLQGIKELD